MQPIFDLVSIGEPLVGLYPVPDEPDLARVIYGGDASNVALAAARLGLRVGFAGAVGPDPYGRGFLRLWQERGVDLSLTQVDESRFTGLYVIAFEEGRHRFAYYRKGSAASAYNPDAGMREMIRATRVLHVSGITQAISEHMADLTFDLMAEARAAGALISYDVNYRAPLWPVSRAGAVVHRTIEQFADILSVNAEEFRTLGLAETIPEFVERYGGNGRRIAVRDGEQGATVYIAGETYRAPAFSVQVADTVGAGDAFDAGLITAHLNGLTGEGCLIYANAVAALTCTQTGSTKGHPRPEEVETLIGAHSLPVEKYSIHKE